MTEHGGPAEVRTLPEASSAPVWARHSPLFFILLVAAVLRLYKIPSLPAPWDEQMYLGIAQHPDRFIRLSMVWLWGAPHVPLPHFLMWEWAGAFGDKPSVIRLLTALYGWMAVLLVYLTGRRFFSREAGLWAAFFLAISPLQLWYSTFISPYPILCVLGAASIYAFLAYLEKGQWRWFAASTFVNGLLLLSHPLGALLVALEGLAILFVRVRDWRSRIAWGMFQLPAFAFVAWFVNRHMPYRSDFGDYGQPSFLNALMNTFADDALHRSFDSAVTLTLPFLSPQANSQLAQLHPVFDWIMLLLIAGLWGSLAWRALRDQPPSRIASGFLIFSKLLGVFLLFALSVAITPFYAYRFLLPLSAISYLLIGASISAIHLKPLKATAIVLLLVCYSYQLLHWLPGSMRTEWRMAGEHVLAMAKESDVLLVSAETFPYGDGIFRNNFPDFPLSVRKGVSMPQLADEARQVPLDTPADSTWIAVESSQNHERTMVLQQHLESCGYTVSTTFFPGASLVTLLRVQRRSSATLVDVPPLDEGLDLADMMEQLEYVPSNEAEAAEARKVLRATLPSGLPMVNIALCLLSEEWLLAGQPRLALAAAEKAVATWPEYPYAHFTKGAVLCSMGAKESARAAFEQAFVLDRDVLYAYRPIVESCLTRAGMDTARQQWLELEALWYAPRSIGHLLEAGQPPAIVN